MLSEFERDKISVVNIRRIFCPIGWDLLCLLMVFIKCEVPVPHSNFFSDPNDKCDVSDSSCPGVRAFKFGEQLMRSEISKSIKYKGIEFFTDKMNYTPPLIH